MRKLVSIVAATGFGLLLGGCYGPAPVAGGYGPPYYEGYYDDFYGPIDEGFWAPDGFFYYGDRDHHFHRAEAAHFRHDAAPGFHHFQTRGGMAAAPHAGRAHTEAEHR